MCACYSIWLPFGLSSSTTCAPPWIVECSGAQQAQRGCIEGPWWVRERPIDAALECAQWAHKRNIVRGVGSVGRQMYSGVTGWMDGKLDTRTEAVLADIPTRYYHNYCNCPTGHYY